MRLPDLVRTTTFRWTLAISAAFTLCILLMFAFVFWQTIAFMSANIDRLNADVTNLIASDGEERMAQKIEDHLRVDPRRIKLTGLFDQHGNRLIGNIESLPLQFREPTLRNGSRSCGSMRSVARSRLPGLWPGSFRVEKRF